MYVARRGLMGKWQGDSNKHFLKCLTSDQENTHRHCCEPTRKPKMKRSVCTTMGTFIQCQVESQLENDFGKRSAALTEAEDACPRSPPETPHTRHTRTRAHTCVHEHRPRSTIVSGFKLEQPKHLSARVATQNRGALRWQNTHRVSTLRGPRKSNVV